MKNYLDKSLRQTTNLSPRGKKEYLIHSLVSLALFIVGAFAFFEFLYILCNMIGAIVSGSSYQAIAELSRMLSVIINLLLSIHLGVLAHVISRPVSYEKRNKQIVVNAYVIIGLAAISFIYAIVCLATGKFGSLVEGYPTRLFPLDNMLLSLVYIALGVLLILYKTKFLVKYPSELPLRNDTRKGVTKVFDRIFMVVGYLCALFAFAAFIYGFYVIDWIHGHTFYGIMLMLVFIVSFGMFAQAKYIYLPLNEELKNESLKKLSLINLAINLVVYVLFFFSLKIDPNAPNDIAYGVLPVEFTASVNASVYIYGAYLLITPFVGFIKSLIHSKDNKKQEAK